MPKREKSTSCTSGWCKNHLFELKPLSSNLHFRKPQRTRMCPRLNKCTKIFQVSIPLLNKDKKYYTPSFILEDEKTFYQDNDKKMLQNHEEKIEEMVEGNTGEIWVPKHGRKRKYCTVCHTEYDDYLTHIALKDHKDKIQKSRYTHFIKELAADCARKRARKIRVPKEEATEETPDSLDKAMAKLKDEEEELQIIEDEEEQEDFNYAAIFQPLQNFCNPDSPKIITFR